MTDKEITERIIREVMEWEMRGAGENGLILLTDGSYFNPIKRMDHAWMVVEKLRDGDWDKFKEFCNFLSFRLGNAESSKPKNSIYDLFVCLCPARAICMAALATVEKMNET